MIPIGIFAQLMQSSFRMIGMATIWEGVVGGEDLMGIAPSFDFESGTIDTIYQRYNIYDPVEDADVPDVVVCCIMGAHAICYATNGFAANKLFITPYLTDSDIVLPAEWVDDYTLTIGAGVTAIDPGENNYVQTVFPIGPNKFIILSIAGVLTYPTVEYELKIVTFSSPTDVSVVTNLVDVTDYISPVESEWDLPVWAVGDAYETGDEVIVAEDGYVYTAIENNVGEFPPENIDTIWTQNRQARSWTYAGSPPAVAFNQSTGQIGISFQMQVFGPYYGGAMAFNLNPETGALTNKSLNLYGDGGAFTRGIEPLYKLSAINSSAYQYNRNGLVEDFSCDGFKSGPVFDSEGSVTTYTSRSTAVVGSSIVTVYAGESSPSAVDLSAAISSRLTALGYTVTGTPDFGTDSYYLLYPSD